MTRHSLPIAHGAPVLAFLLIVSVGVSACATSGHTLVGQAHPPISPDQVQVYSAPPDSRFERIAVLNANSRSAFSSGGPKSEDKVIERLKIEAAKLGANGVILEGFADSQSATVGTGVGSESYGNRSSVGVGLGGSFGIYKKTGHATAILVSPVPSPP